MFRAFRAESAFYRRTLSWTHILKLSEVNNTMQRKEALSLVAIGLGLLSFIGLASLKLSFPPDPPIVALNILRMSLALGVVSFCVGMFTIQSRGFWIVILLALVNVTFFLFGWPFYAVY